MRTATRVAVLLNVFSGVAIGVLDDPVFTASALGLTSSPWVKTSNQTPPEGPRRLFAKERNRHRVIEQFLNKECEVWAVCGVKVHEVAAL